MLRWERALAGMLPAFIRRHVVQPCSCCGELVWVRPRLSGVLRAPVLFARYLLRRKRWTLAAVIVGAWAVFGTPHVQGDYVCRYAIPDGQPCRAYKSCAYYGIHGRRVLHPEPGEACPLVRLLPAAG